MAIDAAAEIRTARLILTPLAVADAVDMVAVLADPSLYTFTGGEPPTIETLERRYAAQVAGPDEVGEQWFNWILRRSDDSKAVGFVQATVFDDKAADVAWLIGVEHQRNRFAAEGAKAMCSWLIGQGVGDITAHIHPDHVASQRVARAIGLVQTGSIDDDGEEIWAAASAALRP